MPYCPGLGPCYSDSTTHTLFALWVSTCAFIGIIIICGGIAIGVSDGDAGPGVSACACLCILLTIGLTIGWRARWPTSSMR